TLVVLFFHAATTKGFDDNGPLASKHGFADFQVAIIRNVADVAVIIGYFNGSTIFDIEIRKPGRGSIPMGTVRIARRGFCAGLFLCSHRKGKHKQEQGEESYAGQFHVFWDYNPVYGTSMGNGFVC